jgi:long-chain acyl-CoA synthetase
VAKFIQSACAKICAATAGGVENTNSKGGPMEKLLTADPSHPAIVMALSGETITHGQLEARANKIAHLLRAVGLRRGDHYAIFMENHPRRIECGMAGERSGLYYTGVNSYLTPSELAYILNNSMSQVLITSQSHLAVAHKALRVSPRVKLAVVVDGPSEGGAVRNLDEATAAFPDTPIPDESMERRCYIHQERQASRKAS